MVKPIIPIDEDHVPQVDHLNAVSMPRVVHKSVNG